MENILIGFSNVFQPMNIVICIGGLFIGVLFGALPGFSATMAVAIFVPFTYVMEPGPALLLNGHLDTVPNGSGWNSDPQRAEVRDGRLYARGASDMKSGLAAMLCAFRELALSGRRPRHDLLLLGTCDEESGGLGAQTAAGYFAAKEAVSKALGTGFRGFGLTDISVEPDELGRPVARLSGGALKRMEALGGRRMHLSIAHEKGFATAVAILED